MPRYIKIYKDNKQRKTYSEKESRNYNLAKYLNKRSAVGKIRRFKTYCQTSGASHSILAHFSLSRNSLRKYANFGLVSGVMPSSW